MSTSFYGLHIAKSGLFAGQKGLEVVGNNISNAQTKGYTRQRLNLSSIPAAAGSGIPGSVSNSTVGAGVRIDNVEQCRDKYLDIRFRNENYLLGQWQAKADALYYVENLFNDNTDAEINDVLNLFFDSLEELSKSPEGEDIRTLVRENAAMFAETMNYYSNRLEDIQNEQNDAISITADKINSLVSQINDYNAQIMRYERNGGNANELRDKRNVLLDELSNMIDITYSENASGVVTVCIGKNNECLVDEAGTYLLSVDRDLPDYYGNTNQFYSVKTASGDTLAADDLKGGTLKGYFDMRDGGSNLNMGVPYFMSKLDNLAKGIAEAVNQIHQGGYTYPSDSNGNTSVKGINFFDPANLTAKTISLDSKIIESVFNIAASSAEIIGDANTGNSEKILELLNLTDKKDIPVISNIEQYLKSIISDIAVQSSISYGKVESETILLDNISYQRESVSGVSTDEEITNMIMFEKAYSAASRLITAIDEQLDTLINRTGIVGR